MAISITSAQAAVAAAPYLLGFTPRDSMVLLLLSDGGLSMSMRVDLPDRPDVGWLQAVLAGIAEPVPASGVLIAYADSAPPETARLIAQWLTDVLSPVLDVVDVMLVTGDRVYPLLCDSDRCCPQDGFALGALRDHPVVAECVASGLTYLNGREDLVAQVQPVLDEVSRAVVQVMERVEGAPRDYEHARDLTERRALAVLISSADLAPGDIVCVAGACRDVHVRDPLLAIVLGSHSQEPPAPLGHVRTRLMYALTHLPSDHAGPVAATLALLAWVDGDGAAALVAADRAMQLDPTNTLAPLVANALQHCLPPSTWESLTADIPLEVLRGRLPRSA